MPETLALLDARFAALDITNRHHRLPYWATSITTAGQPPLATSVVAAAVFTAAFAAIITHLHTKAIRRQFDLHQQDDCPNDGLPFNAMIQDTVVDEPEP